jgi:hypothetical protein
VSPHEPTGDYRVYDEEALLGGLDLDRETVPVETAGDHRARRPPRAHAAVRPKLARFALAVAVGAVVGLVVVSGIRVLAHVASRLGASTRVATGVPQLRGTSNDRVRSVRHTRGADGGRRAKPVEGMTRGAQRRLVRARPQPLPVAAGRAEPVATDRRPGPTGSAEQAAAEFGFEQ